MIAYQLDKNNDSKKFYTRCTEQGMVLVHRFGDLKVKDSADDPEIVKRSADEGRILLTSDCTMDVDHAKEIASNSHCGIIMVGNSNARDHLTIDNVMRNLSKFKQFSNNWSKIKPLNCILYITDIGVEIRKIDGNNNVKIAGTFQYADQNAAEKFTECLKAAGAEWEQ